MSTKTSLKDIIGSELFYVDPFQDHGTFRVLKGVATELYFNCTVDGPDRVSVKFITPDGKSLFDYIDRFHDNFDSVYSEVRTMFLDRKTIFDL